MPLRRAAHATDTSVLADTLQLESFVFESLAQSYGACPISGIFLGRYTNQVSHISARADWAATSRWRYAKPKYLFVLNDVCLLLLIFPARLVLSLHLGFLVILLILSLLLGSSSFPCKFRPFSADLLGLFGYL